MKTLTLFIKESLDNKLMTAINNLKYDFSETSSMHIASKNDRINKAKAQEKIFIDAFNELKTEKFNYNAVSCEEFCKLNNQTYSSEMDSKIGDIIIMDNDTAVMFIDLKVANTNDYIGTPDMLSLVNFASENNDKKYYLCSSLNGSKTKLVLANKIYNLVISGQVNVIVSKDRYRKSEEVQKFKSKIKLVAPKYMQKNMMLDNILSELYDEDFVATSFIDKV